MRNQLASTSYRRNVETVMVKNIIVCMAAACLFFGCDAGDNAGSTAIPSSGASNAAANTAAQNGTFTVDAKNENGTLFENKSAKDETILFTATGEWSFAPDAGPLGADGAGQAATDKFVFPAANTFVLIAKRGTGAFEKVGSKSTLVLKAGERVYFMMNELRGGFTDNRGLLTVSWAKQ